MMRRPAKAIMMACIASGLFTAPMTMAAVTTPSTAVTPPPLSTSLQNGLETAESRATAEHSNFDSTRAATLQALQTTIIASGAQPVDVEKALEFVSARTRGGQAALEMVRARVRFVVNTCAITKRAVQDGRCAGGLSVASLGDEGGFGLAGPPSFSDGSSDYAPTQ